MGIFGTNKNINESRPNTVLLQGIVVENFWLIDCHKFEVIKLSKTVKKKCHLTLERFALFMATHRVLISQHTAHVIFKKKFNTENSQNSVSKIFR